MADQVVNSKAPRISSLQNRAEALAALKRPFTITTSFSVEKCRAVLRRQTFEQGKLEAMLPPAKHVVCKYKPDGFDLHVTHTFNRDSDLRRLYATFEASEHGTVIRAQFREFEKESDRKAFYGFLIGMFFVGIVALIFAISTKSVVQDEMLFVAPIWFSLGLSGLRLFSQWMHEGDEVGIIIFILTIFEASDELDDLNRRRLGL